MIDIDSYLKNNEASLYSYEIEDGITELAKKYGFLEYMIERYIHFLGSKTEEFLSSCTFPLRKAIRCNSLKIDCKTLSENLENKGFTLSRIEWSKFGYRVEKSPSTPSIGSTIEYMKGQYYIQGEASMIPPEALSPKEGELVLDMASSPGGKTTHIAQLMNNSGSIIALESNPARLKKIRSNIARLGVTNVILLLLRGEEVSKLGLTFDKILLDAPCSGEGLIPIDKTRKTKTLPDDLKRFQRTQLNLLVTGYKVLKKNGLMVYSTCSIAPEEDEVIVNFAIKYLGMRAEMITGFPGERGLSSYKGIEFSEGIQNCLRTYPHTQKMEGFFVCLLRKE
ncbi:MAG: RsmB/NOP family class I SAM-dependent RNA methyltransferase [Metallosphaera sp.]|uniref:Ribosomal RNA methyltransferase NOP2 n=1 Tax=Metallosphaera cuprina (strain Ar-4) TaxID=1006006 RepID=F4G3C0_METCR|nr:RsmB/NOP family class I SAM-dependent RNA methyltransferase [Metallosphaera cuprina]AEB94118.1 ribosomal RNA methyltransferase NOP2 [Metallosphaera cuprina Ar-4]